MVTRGRALPPFSHQNGGGRISENHVAFRRAGLTMSIRNLFLLLRHLLFPPISLWGRVVGMPFACVAYGQYERKRVWVVKCGIPCSQRRTCGNARGITEDPSCSPPPKQARWNKGTGPLASSILPFCPQVKTREVAGPGVQALACPLCPPDVAPGGPPDVETSGYNGQAR